MNGLVWTTLIVILVAISTGCARPYYKPPVNVPVATVSFSNLSVQTPQIYIIADCKPMLVQGELIEPKTPDQAAKYSTEIPANKLIAFQYVYYFVINEKPNIDTGVGGYNIQYSKSLYTSTCESTIAFTPEPNKHYEVYFGLVEQNCAIKAQESIVSMGANNKLVTIPTSTGDECPQ